MGIESNILLKDRSNPLFFLAMGLLVGFSLFVARYSAACEIGPALAGFSGQASGGASQAAGACQGDAEQLAAGNQALVPMYLSSCQSQCAATSEASAAQVASASSAACAGYSAANATSNPAGGAPTQAGANAGAGGVACKGSGLNGDKGQALEPLKALSCDDPCASSPYSGAKAGAKQTKQACDEAKKLGEEQAADQAAKQAQNAKDCGQDKKQEQAMQPPTPPPPPPPEEKKKEDPKVAQQPLAAPPSGVSFKDEKSVKTPDFEKKVATTKEPKGAEGDQEHGIAKTKSNLSEGLGGKATTPVLGASAASAVAGNGGGHSIGGGNTGSSSSPLAKSEHQNGSDIDAAEISLAGGSVGKGVKKGSSMLGVTPFEFDGKREGGEGNAVLGTDPLALAISGDAPGGIQNSKTDSASPDGKDLPTVFQIVHSKYINLWLRARL